MWICHIAFVCSPAGHLGCFHAEATVNEVAMNICVQVLVWIHSFSSSGKVPRSGIVESYRPMLSMFNFLRHAVCFVDRIVCCFVLILRHLVVHG